MCTPITTCSFILIINLLQRTSDIHHFYSKEAKILDTCKCFCTKKTSTVKGNVLKRGVVTKCSVAEATAQPSTGGLKIDLERLCFLLNSCVCRGVEYGVITHATNAHLQFCYSVTVLQFSKCYFITILFPLSIYRYRFGLRATLLATVTLQRRAGYTAAVDLKNCFRQA